ncbi:TPA: CPBP family intramembrane metalloprotease, partial [Yersinia enterocolitica]|nr:CPBP family intramembrane metalloprotease [Yersinia enterocolitica]
MWGVLAASLLFLSINRVLSLFLLALSLSIALYHGVLTLPSAAFLLLTLAVALLLKKYRQQKWLAAGLELLLVLAAIALFLHLIPGFNNLKVLDNVKVGPLSAAFSMYYNLDKALVPFILLACLPTLFVAKKHLSVGRLGWLGLIVSIPALLLLAV